MNILYSSMKKLPVLVVAFCLLTTGFSQFFLSSNTSALSGSDFRASNIIDDSVFFNQSAMNSEQIQRFLNAKVPTCRSGYTCLKNYRQDTPSRNTDNQLCNYYNGGNKSAAEIINDVSKACSVNPQVLLVLLQKEQSLVTSTSPSADNYQSATGFGCPDSAPCDAEYYGFFNQIYNSARIYKKYARDAGMYNYRAGRNNNIYYQADNRFTPQNEQILCGYSSVYIQNQATAGLYIYTPYQPNQAALNNLYGTGDGCSAYGNRNFWRMFNDWFGSTYTSGDREGEDKKRIQPIVYNNQIYTFYYDAFSQTLRMATQNKTSGQWEYSILDGAAGAAGTINSNMGGEVTATVYGDSLQLFYYDSSNGNLRHGWYSGSNWNFENLDGDSGSISRQSADVGINPTVTTYQGSLQLFYHDRTHTNLRHAWADSKGWHFENLDGDTGSIGGLTGEVGTSSIVTTFQDSLQLFYYDRSHTNLRHAWADNIGWHFESLDGELGSLTKTDADVGVNPVITTYQDSLQLFYYDRTHTNLRHAWADSKGWHFENLDGDTGSIGGLTADSGISISVLEHGPSLQLFYYDRTHTNLRHAWADSKGWHFENLDGDTGSIGGNEGDIGINPGTTDFGSLQLYYYDRTRGALRHAWADNIGWHFEDLGPSTIY
jgi:hypothetical protein